MRIFLLYSFASKYEVYPLLIPERERKKENMITVFSLMFTDFIKRLDD